MQQSEIQRCRRYFCRQRGLVLAGKPVLALADETGTGQILPIELLGRMYLRIRCIAADYLAADFLDYQAGQVRRRFDKHGLRMGVVLC